MSLITLDETSPSIQHLCKKDKRLSKVIDAIGSLTYEPYEEDPYAFLVHEIIEQMLSIKAGARIYQRLVDLCNGDLSPNNVNKLSFDEIKSIGTATSKVKFIQSLTFAVLNNEINFLSLSILPDNEVYKELTKLPGIGNWTANMYLIFVLNRQDILPYDDAAFLQAYKWLYNARKLDKRTIIKKCKCWKPYSSIAARYLYKALDTGITKINIKEFMEE